MKVVHVSHEGDLYYGLVEIKECQMDAWYVWEAQSMRLAKEKDVDVKAEEGKKRNLKTLLDFGFSNCEGGCAIC